MTAYERAEARAERFERRLHYVVGFTMLGGFIALITYAASLA